MMAKSHIAVGLAAATLVVAPATFKEVVPLVIGASVGSIICDLDSKKSNVNKDAFYGRLIVGIICAVMVVLDVYFGMSVWKSIKAGLDPTLALGIGIFAAMIFICSKTNHRGFAHSFVALAIYMYALQFIYVDVMLPFGVAFISHIVLDLFNKKRVKILWPVKRGFCLGLCYSNRLGNRIAFIAGCCALVLEVVAIQMKVL